ncbi:MAG: GntR family transcriptional regulator [Lentisphaeria bacterium]|nr:GntR family transcriptional regulator [Lentisphaeria bacterium]
MRVPLYQKIAEHILRDIRSGMLKPGDRIPTVREMSEQYSVSAIVGLRVFKELSNSGLVEKHDGEGYFVSSIDGNLRKGRNLVCLFRPMREECVDDNFGNHILSGIMNSAIESNYNFIMPSSVLCMKRDIPNDMAAKQMAYEAAEIPDKAGILLDMRFSDQQISRYIVPIARGVPVVVVGRKSSVPGVKSSCMPFDEVEPQIATLAFRSGARFFFNFVTQEPYGRNTLVNQPFEERLIELGIGPETILETRNILRDAEGLVRVMEDMNVLIRKIAPQRSFCYCSDDHTAQVLFNGLAEKGLVGGKDYGLMGFGGLQMAFNNSPQIGTVVIPHDELGFNAVKLLELKQNEVVTSYSIQVNETL